MIAKITGKIAQKGPNCLFVDVGDITYQIFLPQTVMQRIDENILSDQKISLVIYHYFHVEPSRSIPIMIGFLNEVEKEFFEAFISVSGIGPRAALKALDKPISQIAEAIDKADINFLKSLPGIGQQRAKEIVAKLQNKVGKFGLIKDDRSQKQSLKHLDIQEEVLEVLIQLGYKKPEATLMIKKAFESSDDIQSSEALLNKVYKQKKLK
jgi:Holliday junction DNA helicase RuvA